MEFPKFSVLMSLYIKESASNLEECIQSLVRQTVLPTEIVIVLDGPITKEVENVIGRYVALYPNWIKLVKNPENKGLGLALADGIPVCAYDLIARMDTDDIAREDRFEIQLKKFIKDPHLDICGSHIKEFDRDISNIISERKVPIHDEEIKTYQKRRDAFNHMTVMYKKKSVLNAGNYQDCLLMEDTLLWINMILNGARCENVDDYLVYARTGSDMFERRGGIEYFNKYKRARKKILQTGYISFMDYWITIAVQFIVAIIPNKMRGYIYRILLRR